MSSPFIALEIPTAQITTVDTQPVFSRDGEHGESMIVFVLTESTPNAQVAPASAAATAREEAYPPGIHPDQLRHGGERSTSWAITAEPTLFIAPCGENFDDRAEKTTEGSPAQVAEQAGVFRWGLIAMNEPS